MALARGEAALRAMAPRTRSLLDGLMDGKRAALAQAITLVESKLPTHQREAQLLLAGILARSDAGTVSSPSFRIGLSGPPGAGKSTFIETFGMHLTEQGHKVAVLAVDPSSSRTGGSILGDKTRMPELTRQLSAYIRPSPSGGTLGGVARNTQEAAVLCEAAGYDTILIETVGVGQSEIAVAGMVDMMNLLVPPGGGDELQGIKKGIMEIADMIIVNKADGDLTTAANRAAADCLSAIKFMQPQYEGWRTTVVKVSSRESINIDRAWAKMQRFRSTLNESGALEKKRKDQGKQWMWSHIGDRLQTTFQRSDYVKGRSHELERAIMNGEITPFMAADELLRHFFSNPLPDDGLGAMLPGSSR
eukprot:Clim_evm75s146 gene=Clim_evmTU75s146